MNDSLLAFCSTEGGGSSVSARGGLADGAAPTNFHNGTRSTRLRLWLAKRLLPAGYAIWTYGRYGDDSFDEVVVTKEMRS